MRNTFQWLLEYFSDILSNMNVMAVKMSLQGTWLSEIDASQVVSFGEAGSPPHGPYAQLTWIHKFSPSLLCKYGSLAECALLYLRPEDVGHAPVYSGTRWPVTWRREQTRAMHLVVILCGWGLRRCKAACLSVIHQNGNCTVPLHCVSAVTRTWKLGWKPEKADRVTRKHCSPPVISSALPKHLSLHWVMTNL